MQVEPLGQAKVQAPPTQLLVQVALLSQWKVQLPPAHSLSQVVPGWQAKEQAPLVQTMWQLLPFWQAQMLPFWQVTCTTPPVVPPVLEPVLPEPHAAIDTIASTAIQVFMCALPFGSIYLKRFDQARKPRRTATPPPAAPEGAGNDVEQDWWEWPRPAAPPDFESQPHFDADLEPVNGAASAFPPRWTGLPCRAGGARCQSRDRPMKWRAKPGAGRTSGNEAPTGTGLAFIASAKGAAGARHAGGRDAALSVFLVSLADGNVEGVELADQRDEVGPGTPTPFAMSQKPRLSR